MPNKGSDGEHALELSSLSCSLPAAMWPGPLSSLPPSWKASWLVLHQMSWFNSLGSTPSLEDWERSEGRMGKVTAILWPKCSAFLGFPLLAWARCCSLGLPAGWPMHFLTSAPFLASLSLLHLGYCPWMRGHCRKHSDKPALNPCVITCWWITGAVSLRYVPPALEPEYGDGVVCRVGLLREPVAHKVTHKAECSG